MQETTVFVSHISDQGVGFGINASTGENVYIHPKFVKDNNMDVGNQFNTTVIPNSPELRSKTPWMVMSVSGLVEKVPTTESRKPRNSHSAAAEFDITVLEELRKFTFTSTMELAACMSEDSAKVHNSLSRLHEDGKCARAKVFRKGDQKMASFVLWAEDANDFLSGDES